MHANARGSMMRGAAKTFEEREKEKWDLGIYIYSTDGQVDGANCSGKKIESSFCGKFGSRPSWSRNPRCRFRMAL